MINILNLEIGDNDEISKDTIRESEKFYKYYFFFEDMVCEKCELTAKLNKKRSMRIKKSQDNEFKKKTTAWWRYGNKCSKNRILL